VTRRAALTLVLTIVGVAGFVWLLHDAGARDVAGKLQLIGIRGFAGVLALSFLRYVLRAIAWTTMMDAGVPVMSAVAASIAGDVLGQVTPFSVIASEPAKAMYLRSDVPQSRALAALVAEILFYSLSLAIFIIGGVISMLVTFALPTQLRVVAILSLIAMVAVLATIMWMVWRSPAVASATLSKIPGLNAAAFVDRIRNFEQTMYEFVRQSPSRIRRVIACEIGFHVVSFSESLLVLALLTGRVQPLQAFILDTASRIINIVIRVPFKIGFDELASTSVATAIGVAGADGLSLALVRKGRLLVWAVIGAVLLARRGIERRKTG
jgi:hypothetical protein